MKLMTLVKTSILIIMTGWLGISYAQNNFNGAPLYLANNDSSENTLSDSGITAKIKSKFISEKLFGPADISAVTIEVETTNGVVHLTGTADNQEQIDNAVKLSSSVAGVTKVVNDVTVKK